MKKLTILAAVLIFMFCGTVYADEDMMCAQVITYAQNPETGEWVEYPTPCHTPDGWVTSTTAPDEPIIRPGEVIDPIYPDGGPIIAPQPDDPGDIPIIAPYPDDEPDINLEPDETTDSFTFSAENSGEHVTLPAGYSMRVVLETNMSTGYKWYITGLDREVMRDADIAYTGECSEGTGCAQEQIWTFEALVPGTTRLDMAYYRDWEGQENAIDNFTLDITVSAPLSDDDPSDQFCTMEYKPVCGTDGKTYSNRCVAELQHGAVVAYEGECVSDSSGFTELNDGKTVSLKTGEMISVKLRSNPTTGYGWHITVLDQNVLENSDNTYVSSCPEDEPIVGCGGDETWRFKAVGSGETELVMAYYRDWEGEEFAIQTFTLTVSVAADLSYDQAGKEDDAGEWSEYRSDYNQDGIVDRADLVETRRAMKKEFRTWKEECWRKKAACGDFNDDGVVNRRDMIEKRKERDEAFRSWKIGYWLPATESGPSEPPDLGKNAEISGCGGFEEDQDSLIDADIPESDCKDERLFWEYDETSKRISFLNKNVWLNCCGNHSVTVTADQETGGYEIRETDQPEMDGDMPLRCDCMCFFDFKVDLPDISSDTLRIRLTRHVTDNSGPVVTVWEGELDLSLGQSDILIQENVGWCR